METKFVILVDGHTISIDSWFSKERNPFPLGGLGMVAFRFSLSINISFKIDVKSVKLLLIHPLVVCLQTTSV